MKLVIKGAWYFDGEALLVPHFTGEYHTVDCSRFLPIGELEALYDKEFIKIALDFPYTYNNITYYPAEYMPFVIGDWQLLSDLSELSHTEENYDF